MKDFSHMKIDLVVRDAATNGKDFALNFYGRDAPLKCIRALIEKYDISMGEIYIPMESITLNPASKNTSQKTESSIKEG